MTYLNESTKGRNLYTNVAHQNINAVALRQIKAWTTRPLPFISLFFGKVTGKCCPRRSFSCLSNSLVQLIKQRTWWSRKGNAHYCSSCCRSCCVSCLLRCGCPNGWSRILGAGVCTSATIRKREHLKTKYNYSLKSHLYKSSSAHQYRALILSSCNCLNGRYN